MKPVDLHKNQFLRRMGRMNPTGEASDLSLWDDIFPQSFYDDFRRTETLSEKIYNFSYLLEKI